MSRIPCKRCGAMVLEATANTYGGLCAPCGNGGGPCEGCGKRLSGPNRSGRYLCHQCWEAEQIAQLTFLPKGWSKLEEIDWSLIQRNFVMLAEDLLRRFREVQENDPAYAVVFQLSQNWILDLHINTEGGVAEIPKIMREKLSWGKDQSDEQCLAEVGIWYTEVWKYANLGCVLETPLGAVDLFHYDLFDKLCDSGESEIICSKVDEARLSAIEAIRNSDAFAAILKSPEFRVFVVDDDGLDYVTKAHIGA